MRKKIRLHFTTITPVFIGSGEDIIMGEFCLDNQNNVYRIFPAKLPTSVLESFVQLLENEEQYKIVQIYPTLISKKNAPACKIATQLDEELKEKYNSYIKNGKLTGTYPIGLFSHFQRTNYVPGSSIKGALKTPVMEINKEFFESKYEFNKDPFKNVFVADSSKLEESNFTVGSVSVKNFSNRNNKSSIPAFCQYLNPEVAFYIDVTMKTEQTLISILRCHEFYMRAYERLKRDVYSKDPELNTKFMTTIDDIDPSRNEFLISVGGYGGVFTKSYSDKFYCRMRKKEVTNKKSFRKAEFYRMPMGWCRCRYEEVN